jgi:hypothetical protein
MYVYSTSVLLLNKNTKAMEFVDILYTKIFAETGSVITAVDFRMAQKRRHKVAVLAL